MKVTAIVYTSNTGHTKAYAELLGEKTGLPAYDLKTACKTLPKHAEILYLGWLMAGNVKGYKKAARRFSVKAVCGVGMSGSDTQLNDMLRATHLPEDLPAFYLQGGFELEKLHGIYKLMMKTMKATVGKGLSAKKDRTPEEDDMLNLMLNGGSTVSDEKLTAVLEWIE
ncbi:MAG: hypothetical protein MJ132_06435 [Clostridia bacterium]|nr:hypothetical protein [Clostridia bacterium]